MPAQADETPRRVRADRVAEMTTWSVRTVQQKAAAGLIPGAARLGSVWTFDERQVAAWILEQEEAACRVNEQSRSRTPSITTSPFAGASGGASASSMAGSTRPLYERMMFGRRGKNATKFSPQPPMPARAASLLHPRSSAYGRMP